MRASRRADLRAGTWPFLSSQWGAAEEFTAGTGGGTPEQCFNKLNLLVMSTLDWRELGLKVERPVGRLVSVCSKHRTENPEFT